MALDAQMLKELVAKVNTCINISPECILYDVYHMHMRLSPLQEIALTLTLTLILTRTLPSAGDARLPCRLRLGRGADRRDANTARGLRRAAADGRGHCGAGPGDLGGGGGGGGACGAGIEYRHGGVHCPTGRYAVRLSFDLYILRFFGGDCCLLESIVPVVSQLW